MSMEWFGKTSQCPCGKTHVIEPSTVIYAEDALDRLASVLKEHVPSRRVAVLMDARTQVAAGAEAVRLLENGGWTAEEIVLPDPAPEHSPVCDDTTLAWLQGETPAVAGVVAVGGGVVSDLGKWLAFERDLPYVVVATCASMNGYASANVAPALGGVKSLIRARPAKAVLTDPRVLAAAPYHLTASGLGDILAKSVSSADWKLNEILFGDYYCHEAVNLIAAIEPLYLENPEGIRDRDREAMRALFEGLLLTGVAMTMAETSAPASGGEHLISHTLDMLATATGQEHDLHGRQVGIGTVLCSELYRRVLAMEAPTPVEPPTAIDRPFWGRLAAEVEGHFLEKRERLCLAKERLADPETWARLRAEWAPLVRAPEVVHGCLRTAEAAYRAQDIGIDRARLKAVLLHAHEMRSRFTILDVAWILGILPTAADEIIERFA